jgi:hypothetical protein
MQKLLLSLSLSLAVATGAFAQFGVSGYYTHTGFSGDYAGVYLNRGWDEARPTDGYRLALDYWFRLKKPRVEFLPTLSYTKGTTFELSDEDTTLGRLGYQHFSFFLNTNIYLFDLAGDCGCPTFSKGGPALQKGLFLQVGPGVTYERRQTTALDADGPLISGSSSSTHWGLQAGLGLDIGISDLITLTPLVGLRYYPSGPTLYDIPRQPEAMNLDEPRTWQYFGGLRLGFRLDD